MSSEAPTDSCSPRSDCRAARDAYLHDNGWTLAAYDAATTEASFLGLEFGVPNTPKHRRAIRLHDLHHVATGFGTDTVGEGEISAWELARGLGGLNLYVAGIVVIGALYGALRAPRRSWRAFRAAGTASLFDGPDDEAAYEALLDLDVATLRARLGVPAQGVARRPARLHAHAPRREREEKLTTSNPRSGHAARSS